MAKLDPRKLMEQAILVMRQSVSEPRSDDKASPLVRWPRSGYALRDCSVVRPHPDNCPDRLSGFWRPVEGIAGVPTAIPTQCRDYCRRATGKGESRQLSRRNGGIRWARCEVGVRRSMNYDELVMASNSTPIELQFRGLFRPIPAYSRLVRHPPSRPACGGLRQEPRR